MPAYAPFAWKDFFLAGAGAAAALAGLLFVAMSVNLKQILSLPGMGARAGRSVLMLTEVVVVCLLCLIPESRDAVAVELGLVGLLAWAFVVFTHVRWPRPIQSETIQGATRGQVLAQFIGDQVSTLPVIVAGVSLWIRSGGGLYWLAAATVLLLVNGVASAWILLVDIGT
jgi:hypothetical protein